jgi:hypothetical protein
MIRCVLVGSVLALLLSLLDLAQSHSAFPVDIIVGTAPQLFTADGKTRLIYELHLANFSASAIELVALNVFGGDGCA